jgi:hypothetical protein
MRIDHDAFLQAQTRLISVLIYLESQCGDDPEYLDQSYELRILTQYEEIRSLAKAHHNANHYDWRYVAFHYAPGFNAVAKCQNYDYWLGVSRTRRHPSDNLEPILDRFYAYFHYNTDGYDTGTFHYVMNNKWGTDTLTSPYMPRGTDTEKALFLEPGFAAIYDLSHDPDSASDRDPDSDNSHDSLFGDDVSTGSIASMTDDIAVEQVDSNTENVHIRFL